MELKKSFTIRKKKCSRLSKKNVQTFKKKTRLQDIFANFKQSEHFEFTSIFSNSCTIFKFETIFQNPRMIFEYMDIS